MKNLVLAIFLGVFAIYCGLVLLFGFAGPVALSIQLGRVSFALAVLILYVPAIATIFNEVPPPRRDYLLAGIILTWLSALSFSIWNVAGRVFSVDTSIFSSPIAGFFSLLLVLGGAFHLFAPGAGGPITRWIALAVGLIVGSGLVFGVPLFR